MDDPEYLRAAILEVVENQIRDGTPPETKQTYERLLSEGYSEEDVMKYLGCVFASEMFGILKEGRVYNEQDYVRALKALPKLPWDDER